MYLWFIVGFVAFESGLFYTCMYCIRSVSMRRTFADIGTGFEPSDTRKLVFNYTGGSIIPLSDYAVKLLSSTCVCLWVFVIVLDVCVVLCWGWGWKCLLLLVLFLHPLHLLLIYIPCPYHRRIFS